LHFSSASDLGQLSAADWAKAGITLIEKIVAVIRALFMSFSFLELLGALVAFPYSSATQASIIRSTISKAKIGVSLLSVRRHRFASGSQIFQSRHER